MKEQRKGEAMAAMTDAEKCAVVWEYLHPDKPIVAMDWPCEWSLWWYMPMQDREPHYDNDFDLIETEPWPVWSDGGCNIVIPRYFDEFETVALTLAMNDRGFYSDLHCDLHYYIAKFWLCTNHAICGEAYSTCPSRAVFEAAVAAIESITR